MAIGFVKKVFIETAFANKNPDDAGYVKKILNSDGVAA